MFKMMCVVIVDVVLPILYTQSLSSHHPKNHQGRKYDYSKICKGQEKLPGNLAHPDRGVVSVETGVPWNPLDVKAQETVDDVSKPYHATPEGCG